MTRVATDQLLAEASRLRARGRNEEAEQLYRAASERFDALLHLGVICLERGRAAESAEWSRRALQKDAASVEARCNLATALQVQGQYEHAILEYELALTLNSDYAEAHYGLASALHAVERYDEAIACYYRALVIDPDYAEASYGCAAGLQKLKRYEEAIRLYQKALDVAPDYLEARYGLGTALQALERYAEALACYENVICERPEHVDAQIGLANVLWKLDRHASAVERCKIAISIAPASSDAHASLGALFEQIGQLSEALAAHEKAAAFSPLKPIYYFPLVNLKRMTSSDPILPILEKLSRDRAILTDSEQTLLQFALGKTYSDIGDTQRSLRHYIDGNELKRRRITYDESSSLEAMRRLKAVFTPGFFAARQGQGDHSPFPVFILGMPRSGSTLVEQILASHPDVHGAGEVPFMLNAMRCHGASDASNLFPESLASLHPEQLRNIAGAYLAHLRSVAPASLRVTDKTPANFNFVGLIHLVLPNARIIHTRRDSLDTCMSCFSKLFVDDHQPFSYDLAELGRYYRGYESLMAHWRMLLPEHVMLDVDYELLVGDFEPQARRIVEHCGLDWSDTCLTFHQNTRVVKTASVSQVRQPIYRNAVGRWQEGADELLGPLRNALAHS